MGLTDLEQAALSGELFQPRSNSPTRSDSTSSPLNTDDELASDLDLDDDEDDHKDGFVSQRHPSRGRPGEGATGDSTTALIEPQEGPRTGIKGVINDKKAYTAYTRSETRDKARELRRKMERTAITSKAPQSTKTMSGAGGQGDGDARDAWRTQRIMELELTRKGLREVGKEGFVHAVEKAGWVLVLIYEPVRLQSTLLTAHTTSLLGEVKVHSVHTLLTLYCPCYLLCTRWSQLYRFSPGQDPWNRQEARD